MTYEECIPGTKVIEIQRTYGSVPGIFTYKMFLDSNNGSPVSTIHNNGGSYINLRVNGGTMSFLPEDLIPWSVNAEALYKYIAETELK